MCFYGIKENTQKKGEEAKEEGCKKDYKEVSQKIGVRYIIRASKEKKICEKNDKKDKQENSKENNKKV